MTTLLKATGLFAITAVAEVLGCYLVYLWARKQGALWLLVPAAISLAAFAWLLTRHPSAAGRTFAAYGGVYIVVSLLWLRLIEHQPPDRWDLLGGAVSVAGTAIIVLGPR